MVLYSTEYTLWTPKGQQGRKEIILLDITRIIEAMMSSKSLNFLNKTHFIEVHSPECKPEGEVDAVLLFGVIKRSIT